MKTKKIIKKEKREMKDRVEGYILWISDIDTEYICQEQILDMATDGYYDFLEQEYGSIVSEIWDELNDCFKEELEKYLIEAARREIKFELNDYKTIALVLGIQHIHTPYKYYPSYKVLSEKILDKEGVQAVLEKNGISPHAWGVMSNINNWGNYWWLILTSDNYKESIEVDLDVALAVLSNGYEIFINGGDDES